MRIVNLCLGGPVVDGWNYQDNLLPKYQKKNGHDVIVIASKWVWNSEGRLEIFDKSDYFNEDGVKMIRLDLQKGQKVTSKFKKYRGVYETLEKCEPDVLFVHGVSYRDVKTAAKYLKNHPNVIGYADNHADFSNSAANWFSKYILHKIIWRHYAQMLIPHIKKFYGVLPGRVDFLIDMYHLPKDKCELLVMGADDEKVEKSKNIVSREQLRQEYGINKDDFLIVTGGKIDQWKIQTLDLMQAVREIDDDSVKLIVFGSVIPELSSRVKKISDGKLVQYIGWIEADSSYEYFAAADLVCFPGRHSVFWEQVVGQGIPMICKDWSGTHHVDLGGNVIFLKEAGVAEIRNTIEYLLENQGEYKKMKKIAEEKGMKNFSYKDIARRSITL